MYNTKVDCSYYKDDIFLPTDNISEFDKNFIRDAIYRQEFLNIFNLDDYDNNKLFELINQLFKKIKNTNLNKCIEKASKIVMSTDLIIGLQILFSFDYMYLTHICICEYFDKGLISELNLNNLFNKIK